MPRASASLNGWKSSKTGKTLRFVMDGPDPHCGSGLGGLSLQILCETGQKRAEKGAEKAPFSVVPHSEKGFARARGGFLSDIKTGFGRYWIGKRAGRPGRPAFNRSPGRILGVSESSGLRKTSRKVSKRGF